LLLCLLPAYELQVPARRQKSDDFRGAGRQVVSLDHCGNDFAYFHDLALARTPHGRMSFFSTMYNATKACAIYKENRKNVKHDEVT
jgi:hypothetical protein